MIKIFLTGFFILLFVKIFSQTDTSQTDTTFSVYGNLEVRRFYFGGIKDFINKRNQLNESAATTQIPGDTGSNEFTSYQENGKPVDRKTVKKFYYNWNNLANCTPCILLIYDLNDRLIRKSVLYTDCPVGYWIVYDTSGWVRLTGHFKENKTLAWDSAFFKGNCKQDGIWTYFDSKGKKLYNEYWNDGVFIRQSPEKSIAELWGVEFILNKEKNIDRQTITLNQLKNLTIIPGYKNSSRKNTTLKIRLEVTSPGYKKKHHTYSIKNFKKISASKMISGLKVSPGKQAYVQVMVYDNDQPVLGSFIMVIP